jgi:HK97 family phage major capsid protein
VSNTALKEAKEKVTELSLKALAIAENHGGQYKSAADQKAALEPLEADIKKWTDEVENLDYVEAKRKAFAQNGQPIEDAADSKNDRTGKSLGEQFVQSQGYKDLTSRGFKGGQWSSGDIELKAPFFEGTAGAPGDGYAPAAFSPTLVPGFVDIRFRALTIADLFPSGTTESPLIRYLVETIAENGAAAIAEGELKPESQLKLEPEDETLHKIVTFLSTSDEMLEDWAQTQSYINARLALFVKLEEEVQLLRGDGAGSNLVGILNREGLAATITKGSGVSEAADNAMDAIYRQITRIRITQFIEPDAIVVDPIGWEGIMLSKNEMGVYYAGGPFISEADRTLWGKRTAVTPAMDENEALVGAFAQGGQIFRKGGLTVSASNSHADYFQRNKTAIRAEERLALALYRPGAFGLVDNL